jgi:hypothetical protein
MNISVIDYSQYFDEFFLKGPKGMPLYRVTVLQWIGFDIIDEDDVAKLVIFGFPLAHINSPSMPGAGINW